MKREKKTTPWTLPAEALDLMAAIDAATERQKPKLERVTTAQRERDPRWNGLSERQGQQLSLLLRVALDHFMPEVGWRYSLVLWSHRPGDALEAVDYTAASNHAYPDGDTVEWLEEFVDAWKREGKP